MHTMICYTADMLLTIFTPNPPYDFDLLLAVLSRYHPALDVVRDGAYFRALRAGDAPVVVRVTSHGIPTTPQVHVEIAAGIVNNVDRAALIATLRHMLNIAGNRTTFRALAADDPTLRETLRLLGGLPAPRMTSVYEALITTTVEQQISLSAAVKGVAYLVAWGRGVVEYESMRLGLLPTPEQLAAATEADLTPTKITFRRMRLLIDLAAQIADGRLPIETLRDMPPADAYRLLTSIKGVGHWTAAWTLIKGVGYHGYVFENDVALQSAVGHYFYGLTGRAARVSPGQVIDTFARFGDYAGEAAYYTIMRWLIEHY